ncbi:MAG: chemotaxis protein CheA [Desulfuromonas sp.]|nr:MAG: chemotaxis protein CheA [Desulfuromonas sp.]
MDDTSSSRAIKDFLAEAEEIIEKLNLDLVTLGDSAESGDYDPEQLNSIFREAHSLKGLSGMFGFNDICDLAHHMENLLDSLRLGKVSLDAQVVEVLFASLDSLTRLVNGKGDDEAFTLDVAPIMAQLEAVLSGKPDTETSLLAGIDPAILTVLTEYEEHRLSENLKKGRNLLRVKANFNLSSFDQDLAELSDLLKGQGEVISTLPCAGDSIEHLTFQLIFGTASSPEEITALVDAEGTTVELLRGEQESAVSPDDLQKGAVALETASPPAATVAPAVEAEESSSLRSISRTVRVDIDKLDTLMNIVGELVLSKGAIFSLADQIKASGVLELGTELQKATRLLERRLDELQKGVMEVRMVPVAQLFEKMIRIVRRVAGEHGKKVGIDLRGGETELDKLIVEDLSDPLMHIIRNAIDHGIETVEERIAAGKPEKGTICLWASQKGNHVVIEVRDDGRGIDPEKVRRKAVEKGLIAADAELTREGVYDLLFTPGFSTRDEVSDLSGRGVGMDVVHNNIAALSGMIEMESEVGQGTTLSITLPITLAIIKALVVRISGKTYAIPINAVLETLMIEHSAIRTIERREVIELRQSTLPLLRLSEVFDLEGPQVATDRSFIVVIGMAEKRMGVVVDELVGQQDVVIKSLGGALSFVRGIAGAADLGNQKTILVLDVGGLMSEALRGDNALYV